METEKGGMEIDLLHLLSALLKKWWLLLLATILGGSIAFGYTYFFSKPVYEASAYLYVNSNSVSVGTTKISLSDLSTAQSLVDTYSVILQRRLTLEKVIEEAHLDYTYEELYKMVQTSAVNGTEIFSVKVKSHDPDEARIIANTIVEVLPERISSIIQGCSVSVVDLAVTPQTPTSPSYPKNLAIGMVIGFILCGAVIVLLDIFNDAIDSEEWINNTFGEEMPLLASCPDANDTSTHKYGRYGRYGRYRKYGYSTYYAKSVDSQNDTSN